MKTLSGIYTVHIVITFSVDQPAELFSSGTSCCRLWTDRLVGHLCSLLERPHANAVFSDIGIARNLSWWELLWLLPSCFSSLSLCCSSFPYFFPTLTIQLEGMGE